MTVAINFLTPAIPLISARTSVQAGPRPLVYPAHMLSGAYRRQYGCLPADLRFGRDVKVNYLGYRTLAALSTWRARRGLGLTFVKAANGMIAAGVLSRISWDFNGHAYFANMTSGTSFTVDCASEGLAERLARLAWLSVSLTCVRHGSSVVFSFERLNIN